jgi:hypothetical protein
MARFATFRSTVASNKSDDGMLMYARRQLTRRTVGAVNALGSIESPRSHSPEVTASALQEPEGSVRRR